MRIEKIFLSLLLFLPLSPAPLQARVTAPEQALLTPAHVAIPPHEADSSVLREEAVTANLALVRDPATTTLLFPVFGQTLELVRDSRKVYRDGSVIWSGRVKGQWASTAILVAGKQVLMANIATQPTKEKAAEYYEIRHLGRGQHVLRHFDPSRLASEDPTPRRRSVKRGGAAADDPLLADVMQLEEVGERLDQTRPLPAVHGPERRAVDVRPAGRVPDLAGARVPAQPHAALEHRSQGALLGPIDGFDPDFARVVEAGGMMDEGDFRLVGRDRDP